MSSLQTVDGNRPYPEIAVDGYFGAQTQQAVVGFQSVHNQARGWAAKFVFIILIALIVTLLDLITEVFRTMPGRPAFGDPLSQKTRPQMRAGYGS